jgi:hypothetical protein
MPKPQRHDVPSKTFPPVQVVVVGQLPSEFRATPPGQPEPIGQLPSELRATPPGHPPTTGGRQLGPLQPGSTMKHWPLRPLLAPSGQLTTMLPQVPAAMASRVQHVPFTGNVGNGQDVVVGIGQFPSLLRGLPSGQPDATGGGLPPDDDDT